jgi:single-strand DNA-binding protein
VSEGFNRVVLLGNLGADPELRMTGGGTAVLKLRLATSESYLDRNKQRQERTEWHRVVVWSRRAEALAKILAKGDRLLVEGSLRTSSYDDKDGNKRYTTEIVAQNVVLSGSARGGNGGGRSSESDNSGGGGGGGAYDDADYGGLGIEDEIPFITPFDVKRRHVDRI